MELTRPLRTRVPRPGLRLLICEITSVAIDEYGEIEQTPLRRLGEPDDISDIVAFLVSDEGRWITGQNIGAIGGVF